MAFMQWNTTDVVMNLLFAIAAVVFGWLIKRIPSDKGRSWFLTGYIALLAGLTAFWIGWVPSRSLTTLYASLLGIAPWIGVGLYKIAPTPFDSGRRWIVTTAALLIGATGWMLLGWLAVVLTIFAVVWDIGEGIKVTKGKSDLSLGAWKGYVGKRGFWVLMSLSFFLMTVALAHTDLLAITSLWLVLVIFGAIEYGKRELSSASALTYAVMTIFLVYVVLTVSSMITF